MRIVENHFDSSIGVSGKREERREFMLKAVPIPLILPYQNCEAIMNNNRGKTLEGCDKFDKVSPPK